VDVIFIIKTIHNDRFLKRRCIFSFVLTLVFLMSVTSAFAAPWSDPVTIIDGNESRIVYSDASLVKDILSQENVKLTASDMVYPLSNNAIPDDRTIIIKRLKLVDVDYAGHNISYWTAAETYREFILEGKSLADLDDIYDVNLDDKLSQDGNKIKVIRVDHVTQYDEEQIPYTTSVVQDNTIPLGERKVTQKGENGIISKAYDVEYHNGVEISRTFVSEKVKQPVNEIISEGTLITDNVAVVNGQTIQYKKMLTCQATAYDLSFESCGKWPGTPGYGITASGTYAKVGTVAVDPRVIPLGTKMFIVSTDGSYVYGYCTAEDTGGAIKGNKVDLFYNTRSECMQFGRRSVKVYIL